MAEDSKRKTADGVAADPNEILHVFGGNASAPMIPWLVEEIRRAAGGLPECFYLPD